MAIGFFQKQDPPPKNGAPIQTDNDSYAMIDELVTAINENFQPATHLGEADSMLTTIEIYEELRQCYPSDLLSPALIADRLQQLGFRLHMLLPMHFVWLLRRTI
ncbi:MAG: hypothetical protein INR69_15055 [Mucilaginibacter polytrichastri]|nr:hypothetical protein [Mucilaginibacter polytrichastri]